MGRGERKKNDGDDNGGGEYDNNGYINRFQAFFLFAYSFVTSHHAMVDKRYTPMDFRCITALKITDFKISSECLINLTRPLLPPPRTEL